MVAPTGTIVGGGAYDAPKEHIRKMSVIALSVSLIG